FVEAENRGDDFAPDLPLDPGKIFLDLGFGVTNVLLREVAAEESEAGVAGGEIGGDVRLLGEKIASEIADARLDGEKDAAPEEQLLKRRGFGHGRNNVRSDTTAAKNLAAAIGQLYLRAAGRLGVVVVV